MKRLILVAVFMIIGTAVFSQSEEVLREAYEAGEDKLNADNCGYDSCVFYGAVRWKYYFFEGLVILWYAQKDAQDKTKVNVCYNDGELFAYFKLRPTGKWEYIEIENN